MRESPGRGDHGLAGGVERGGTGAHTVIDEAGESGAGGLSVGWVAAGGVVRGGTGAHTVTDETGKSGAGGSWVGRGVVRGRWEWG